MKNYACLELDTPPVSEGFAIPATVTAAPTDPDGLPVPPPYGQDGHIIPGWMKLTPKMRLERSEAWVAKEIVAANAPKRPVAKRSLATRFSTRQAVAWGKAKGWTVLAVEEDRAYQGRDGRWKRITADQKFGADVVFRAPGVGVVAVQAAGRSERKAHWERFMGLGGHERGHEAYDEFWYVEFDRGVEKPVWEERWI